MSTKNSDNSEIDKVVKLLSNVTEVRVPEKLVFVVGVTGTGKSTLTQFIVNNAELRSVLVSGTKLIRGDASISHTVTESLTKRPNVVSDPKTGIYFADCPGFSDTRGFIADIDGALYTKLFLNAVKELKIIAVVDHNSLTPDGHRVAFTDFLEHMSTLLNVTALGKYTDSIGLVVSKVDIAPESDEAAVKRDIMQTLTTIEMEQHKNTNYVELIKMLTRQSGEYVEIFRRPSTVSDPVYKVHGMRDNQHDLRKLVFDKLNYSTVDPSDFKMTISEKTQLKVQSMTNKLKERLEASIPDMWKDVLKVADLPKDVQINESYGVFNKLQDLDRSLRSENEDMTPPEFFELLRQNQLPIQPSLLDTFEKRQKSWQLLLVLLNEPQAQFLVNRTRHFNLNDVEVAVTRLRQDITHKLSSAMTQSVKTVLMDFNSFYDSEVTQCQDLKGAEFLLRNLIDVTEEIASHSHSDFTVTFLLVRLNKCLKFNSSAEASLKTAEGILLNVTRVDDRPTTWIKLKETVMEHSFPVNSSAWKMSTLFDQQVDSHVEELSRAVVNYFLKNYRNRDRWFQKSVMLQPLRALEPIIQEDFKKYTSFLNRLKDWLVLYNSSTYDKPLSSLEQLQPNAEFLLNTLPGRHRWARKLNSATEYMRNSATPLASPINTVFRWAIDAGKSAYRTLTAFVITKTLPSNQLLLSSSHLRPPSITGDININLSLLLLDLMVRKFTKTKYTGTYDEDYDEAERRQAQAIALNIIEDCEVAVDKLKVQFGELNGRDMDYVTLQKNVINQLVNCSNQVAVVREAALMTVKNNFCESLLR